jgi:hypothetical protein
MRLEHMMENLEIYLRPTGPASEGNATAGSENTEETDAPDQSG